MKQNIGLNERIFRILVSFPFIYFAFKYSVWLSIIALLLFVTGVVGWSPSYEMLKIDTNKKNPAEKISDDKKSQKKPSKKKK